MQSKLVITIADVAAEVALQIAQKYRRVELRLDRLSLTAGQVLGIIAAADMVVLTGLWDAKTDLLQVLSGGGVALSNLVIDCPAEVWPLFDGHPLVAAGAAVPMLSSHYWGIGGGDVLELFGGFLERFAVFVGRREVLVKFAVEVSNAEQLADLFSIFGNFVELSGRLVLVPLGERYRQGRLVSLLLGSCFMFCYITEPVASGQMSYLEMISY